MRADVRVAVEAALGARVIESRSVSGGDINEAHRAELEDGRRVFVKTHARHVRALRPSAPSYSLRSLGSLHEPRAPAEMFAAEAHGLSWLRDARAIAIPEVLAVGDRFLALEWLESGRPRAGFDDELGRGLAELHRHGAPSFGLERDNFIGRLPQDNTPAISWAELYAERRLRPMAWSARRLLGPQTLAGLERLCGRLPSLLGPDEPPARLHGDLWGGNLHVTPNGAPCLIDPAVYGGHREVDLAMMRLFGGFSERVFSAYEEAFALAPGHRERVDLYQLYPLLVHVNLFGQSYVGAVQNALGRYV